MLPSTITEKVIGSISKIKKIPAETIHPDSSFEELKLDSLDGLDLLFELEEAFDLSIADDRARSLRSVSSVVQEIEKLLSERTPVVPAED